MDHLSKESRQRLTTPEEKEDERRRRLLASNEKKCDHSRWWQHRWQSLSVESNNHRQQLHVVDRLVLTLLTFGQKVEPQEAILAAKMCLFF